MTERSTEREIIINPNVDGKTLMHDCLRVDVVLLYFWLYAVNLFVNFMNKADLREKLSTCSEVFSWMNVLITYKKKLGKEKVVI